MKRKIYLIAGLLFVVLTGNSQFVSQSINYPNPAYSYWPDYMSIVDPMNVWLGTSCLDINFNYIPYSSAVKTTDGGNTWTFSAIPVPDQPIISGVTAVDANTCFYVFTDNFANGSIWKTTNGGTTWQNTTTTQFSDPSGYADFYCAFDANEGVAVGDPTLGYFEIQRTTDGGQTWNRVSSNLIPPNMPNEYATENGYARIGDYIWFPTIIDDGNGTYSTRIYKSVDRGQTWIVTPIVATNLSWVKIAFSTLQEGVLYDPGYDVPVTQFYRTSDRGDSWIPDSTFLSPDTHYLGITAVPGIGGGFVIGTNENSGFSVKVEFTPDFFNTVMTIDSNLEAYPYDISFKDASTGWLEGDGSDTTSIWKFNGLLLSVANALKSSASMSIIPNPSSGEALVKISGLKDQDDLHLKIFDVSGQQVGDKLVTSNTGWTKLNASSYNSGVYIVQVVSNNQVITHSKWIVQH